MLKELMHEKLNESRKNRNIIAKEAYEAVVVSILNAEKSGKFKFPLSEDDIIFIIQKEVKKYKESQSFYKVEDPHYAEFQTKINTLTEYLPKELSEDEVKLIIKKTIESDTSNNQGKIIGLVIKQIGNRFDKAKIANMVKEYLSGV